MRDYRVRTFGITMLVLFHEINMNIGIEIYLFLVTMFRHSMSRLKPFASKRRLNGTSSNINRVPSN